MATALPKAAEIPAPRTSRWTKRSRDLLLLAAPLLLLAALFIYPFCRMVAESLRGGLTHYGTVLGDPVFVHALIRTVVISALVTAICLVIALPLTFELTRPRNRIRSFLLAAVIVSLWISILARTYSWLLILKGTGLLNSVLEDLGLISQPLELVRNQLGIVIGMVSVLLPFMVVSLLPAMRSIDPRLLQAAQSLGARRLTTLRRVVVPLSIGGIATGCLLTFIIGIAFFVTPAILGAPSDVFLSQIIAREIERFQEVSAASAMGVILTMCVLPLFFLIVAVLDPVRTLRGGR